MTFLFTDIEGSTQLHHRLGDNFAALIALHDQLLTEVVERHRGTVVKSLGDGIFAAFPDAGDAVRAAVAAQRELALAQWPGGAAPPVRMGAHCGPAEPRNGDYVALAVAQAARISAAAHGGQLLASAALVEVGGINYGDCGFRPLGRYRLKDFPDPVELYQAEGAGLQDDFPALRAMPVNAHNVPSIATSFVGRRQELDELGELLAASRLVTVVGPGGNGKTRLAFEYARTATDRYPDGTWVVLLAGLDHEESVPARLAAAVGVREQPPQSVLGTTIEQLAGRRLLLVLDNCEHLVEGVAAVASEVLAHCPDVSMLATSREPLHVAGEFVWRVPTLTLPTTGALSTAAELDDPQASDAVRLFVQRARSSDPAFTVSDGQLPTLARVCRRLDGLPLAIELAAARLRHLSLDELDARLERVLPLLTGGPRDLPERQRTLRGAIEWSYALLTEEERILFRRLAVFRNLFDLAAAETVCVDEELGADRALDALSGLVDRSIVSVVDGEPSRQYRLLATLREFAEEQLRASGDEAALRDRHVAYVLDRGDLGAWSGTVEVEQLTRLEDDLRAAQDWSFRTGNTAQIGRLARVWAGHSFFLARYREARPVVARALALGDHEPGIRAELLYRGSLLAICDADADAAAPLAEELRAFAAAQNLPLWIPRARHLLGDTAVQTGDLVAARSHYQAVIEDADEPLRVAVARRSLGDVAGEEGRPAEQEKAYRDALAEMAQLGADFEEARTLVGLGWLLAEAGRPDALDVLRRTYRLAADRGYTGAALAGVARVCCSMGDPARALTAVSAARRMAADRQTTLESALGDYQVLSHRFAQLQAELAARLPDDVRREAERRGQTVALDDLFAPCVSG